MDFRSLLLKLDELGLEYFTSRDVALKLRASVKQVSNDLRRLHQMGFLRRRRRKRFCLSRNGRLCCKGYEYVYSFSRQGLSYVRWLRGGRLLDDLREAELAMKVFSSLPEDLRDEVLIEAASRLGRGYRGPRRRFMLFDEEVFSVAAVAHENVRLQRENSVLRAELVFSIKYLSFLLGYFRGLASNYMEENARLRQALGEVCKLYMEDLGSLAKSYIESVGHLIQVINVQNATKDMEWLMLANALPREKLVEAVEFIAEFERKAWRKYASRQKLSE